MKSDRVPVAIVGAGFSGTMMSAQLARRGIASLLIEGGGRDGQGIAYSTGEPAHVLNVRAEGMSAWPDEPADFAARHGDPRGFAQRRFFGSYLRQILNEAVASGHVELVATTAVRASRRDDQWEIALEDGGAVVARALVVANGNQPPEPFTFSAVAGARFVDDPWGAEAKAAIRDAAASGDDVLLVGTGLTMVDAVLSLAAAGHRGRIVALSRRGQIPKAHADFDAAPVEIDAIPQGNALGLFQWLRRRGAEVGWRAAVDSLRPHSHALWQRLDVSEQRRFLRHARPYWDVHRHRIAPQVAQQLHDLIAAGRLEIVAGRIGQVRALEDGLEVQINRRGQALTPLASGESPSPLKGEGFSRFAWAINCTGPLGSIGRTRDPMLRQLLDDGLVEPDQLGIGLAVDGHSRAGESLWALGPLTKGRYWEIVAVPDIRGQAAAVADDIAKELNG